MGDAWYNLLLGVEIHEPEIKLVEPNPAWEGEQDQKNLRYILNDTSVEDFEELFNKVYFDERYSELGGRESAKKAVIEKFGADLMESHIFPNGKIQVNYDATFGKGNKDQFADEHKTDISRLCFIERDHEGPLFGVSLLYMGSQGIQEVTDEQISNMTIALNQKDKIANMINAFGYKFKPQHIKLRQHLLT